MTTEDSNYDKILRLIDVALKEDIRGGDITSEACIKASETISGEIRLKQGGHVAGLPFLKPLFTKLDPKVEVRLFVDEGTEQGAGTILGTVSGPARAIFAGERVALNLIGHASGIATITAEYVERVEGTGCDILDTRKTLPGLRCLEKYAVRLGGGVNHRFGLDDRFILKKNHYWFIARESRFTIRDGVRLCRAQNLDKKIEVEAQTLDMVQEALEAEVDIIRLDNLPLNQVRKAVKLIDGAAYVEASGKDITLETIHRYAETGINGISVGALTHSIQDLNITLRF